MSRRFAFDNLLSLVGAWVMFLLPFYWFIRIFVEYLYDKKYAFRSSYLKIFKESLYELTPGYWWHKY